MKLQYTPISGKNAGKKNFENIKNLLEKKQDITGVEIAKKLNLSLPTVYSHLKKLQN